MYRRLFLSLVVLALVSFAGASDAQARGCYRGGYGHYHGVRTSYYHSAPRYYGHSYYGPGTYYRGYPSYYGPRGYYGSGVYFSIGF
ncbi:MAG: hypothetical protein KDA57_10890 [Planctomycetales bacterium]|nr:hypothetical protein [Planctomycetales bacterium]